MHPSREDRSHLAVGLALASVALVGCGRRGFDERTDARNGGAGDATDLDADTCAAALCDGFDNGVIGDWDMAPVTGGGSYAVTNGQLVVTLPATGDSVFLTEYLPAPTTFVEVRMKLGYTTTNVGTNCELDLVALNWLANTCADPFGFYLVRDGSDRFNLQETNGNATCSANRNNYVSELTPGLHDVKMTITVGSPGRARLETDGNLNYDIPTVQPVPSSMLVLRLGGVIVRNAAAGWTITYDDVYVTVQ